MVRRIGGPLGNIFQMINGLFQGTAVSDPVGGGYVRVNFLKLKLFNLGLLKISRYWSNS